MSSAGRHDSAHCSSRLSTAAGSSWGSVVIVLAHMPCLQAFMLTARFPRSDFGPVDRLAFLRLMALRSSGDSFIAVQLPVVVVSRSGARSIGGCRPSFSYHRESHRDRSHDLGLSTARFPPGLGR